MTRTALIAILAGGVAPALVVASIAAAGVLWSGSAPSSFALEGLPEATVRNYHFVESQPAVVSQIPCYCGCHGLGHSSLLDCYIRRQGGYESHASGCGICGMEADDVERMLLDGRDAETIRTYIDATYSRYGKPTDTPGGPSG